MAGALPTEILDDTFFAGNEAAFSDLQEALSRETFLAFTGAGTSAPMLPTWTAALEQLLTFARDRGTVLAGEAAEISAQIRSDPL